MWKIEFCNNFKDFKNVYKENYKKKSVYFKKYLFNKRILMKKYISIRNTIGVLSLLAPNVP